MTRVFGQIGGYRSALSLRKANEIGQAGDAVRAEHDIDVRGPFPQGSPLLLGEAPSYRDEAPFPVALPSPKRAEGAVDLLSYNFV